MTVTPHVAIVGAGISGIGAAIQLLEDGHRVTILEKASTLGGTWRDNHYPGLTCDVPAFVYTYSFARSFASERLLSGGASILEYLAEVFDRFDLAEVTRFGTEVSDARWDGACWHLAGPTGPIGTFDAVVHASGFLHHPRMPDIAGIEDFAGRRFHSARWPDADSLPGNGPTGLGGQRVGIIGTGSTGVQLTTELSRHSDVRVFQRTPQWVFPFPDLPVPAIVRRACTRWPRAGAALIESLERFGDWFIGGAARGRRLPRALFLAGCRASLSRIRDRGLRKQLTPTDEPMCKRPVMSAGFHRAVQRPSVSIIDSPIDRFVPEGIRTTDGTVHPLDVVVFATGFDAHAYMRPMAVTGRGDRDLADAWARGPVAYRTIGLHGFPNMFLLLGPHAPLLSVAIHHTVERQSRYLSALVDVIASNGGQTVEPTEAATDRWVEEIRDGLTSTVWDGECASWYVDDRGLAIMWPFDRERWFATMASPELDDYDIVAATPR